MGTPKPVVDFHTGFHADRPAEGPPFPPFQPRGPPGLRAHRHPRRGFLRGRPRARLPLHLGQLHGCILDLLCRQSRGPQGKPRLPPSPPNFSFLNSLLADLETLGGPSAPAGGARWGGHAGRSSIGSPERRISSTSGSMRAALSKVARTIVIPLIF